MIKKDKTEAEAKVAELINDLQRTRADFENYRKQVEAQKQALAGTTKLATVYKVLPLLDDLDRAIITYPELAPLQKSLQKTLDELHLQKINSAPGAEFNPNLHDAITVEDGEGEKEVVAETLRPGYYYENEVLRPAMVKVRHLQ
ncbi:MAG: nucleotide exchange factor GrpE [Candidatus Saccharibacteria bacterium]|nr:nucleotide exchange factor GrpE [Candidatus Saccharibacteria bacterium]